MLFNSLPFSIFCLLVAEGFLQSGKRICYDGLGCYSTGPPFWSAHRLLVALPDRPKTINTTFVLFSTDDNGKTTMQQVLSYGCHGSLQSTSFDARRPTIFIVHGFVDNTDNIWVVTIVREFLKHGNVNVLGVDWRAGSRLPYTQAAANTRVVGAEIANMIRFIHNETQVLSYTHIIGHSLGAHVAGYAGARLLKILNRKVDRITGLDPAEPYFEHTDPIVRLDPTDAHYVDVIHTDAGSFLTLGLGLYQPVGHVDIYPNGGKTQPGCIAGMFQKAGKGIWDIAMNNYHGAEEAVSCSHKRAIYLFTESINSKCKMIAYPCSSWQDFEKGLCLSCALKGCQQLGYHSKKAMAKGIFYLATDSRPPFCSEYYLIAIKVSKKQQKKVYGQLEVQLIGQHDRTSMIRVTRRNLIIKPGDMFTELVTSNVILGSLRAVWVKYVRGDSSWSWLYGHNIKIGSLLLYKGSDSKIITPCTTETLLNDTMQMLIKNDTCK